MSRAYGTNTLTRKAADLGISVEEMVRQAVVKHGSISGAAAELDCANNAVRYWLEKAGLKIVTRPLTTLEKIGSEAQS